MKGSFRVLGAGVWGLAFSNHLITLGHDVTIYRRKLTLKKNEKTELSLCGNFEDKILPLSELSLDNGADAINIIASNSQGFADMINKNKQYFSNLQRIVWLTKGLEHTTGSLFSEYLTDKFGNLELAIISGPSFAEDLCQNKLMEVSLAHNSTDLEKILMEMICSDYFKAKSIDNIRAIEVAGVIKNIAAILCGMAYANNKELQIENIIDKACKEVKYTADLNGNEADVIINSPGCIGDMNLTCKQNKSRNFRFGQLLADEKISIHDALDIVGTVEGYLNCITLVENSNLVCGELTNVLYKIVTQEERTKNFIEFLES